MIKKRVSKKLLAGLGASIAFSTTAFISGLGVKAIINNVNNDVQELRFNRINEANFSQIPNLSTPTRDMFLDTTRLGSVHAGTVRKGQTLTPWGWLGLYEEDNKTNSYSRPSKQKLALTGWNGEILWINDEFRGQSFADNKADIFDIKYDWNTDLIFLTRSGNPNGLFKPADVTTVGENDLMVDVLEAKTGTRLLRIQNGSGSTNDLHDFAWRSFFAIRDHFFNVTTDLERIKDLYSLDITSLNGQQNQALAFYMPNFMQLYQKNQVGSAKTGTLPNFAQVLADFQILTRGWVFDRNGTGLSYGTRLVDPRNSGEINGSAWTFNDAFSNQRETLDTSNFYLLTNPFWTAGNQANQFVLHFIVANDAGDTYHKTIGFNLVAPQPDRNTVITEFDKTEKIGSASNNTNQFNIKLKPNEWGNNAASWNHQFINANLKINKNMFDNNFLTFAFPVAASQNTSGNFPIFDVAQIKINAQGLIDRSTNNNQLSSRIFNFGNQILDTNGQINPWPDVQSNKTSPTHNYNRLISISPFDNTFIYNAMPNLQGINGVYNATDKQNKFLNFWLVDNKNNRYKPLIISNDSNLGGQIPGTIANINNLINEGFTFDLKSLDTNGNGAINLYFNHSGTERNDWYGSPTIENVGMRSAKIGLLDDPISISSSWSTDITSAIPGAQNQVVQINNESFATLIHSRADMTKWYARTQFNFDNPGNLWTANQQINQTATSSERVQATAFNQPLSNAKVKQKDGVDLVSHWQIGQGKYNGNTTSQSNYQRLNVKRPVIKADAASTQQVLDITTSYDIDPAISSKYETIFSLNNDAKTKLTFKTNQQITNASWQIFSSWSKDAKMITHATSSDSIDAFTSSLTTISTTPQWFDARLGTTASNNNFFGQIHNAIIPDTTTSTTDFSLRTMLQIERPANAPAWLRAANSDFFKPYPISGSEYNGETNFQSVLTNLIAWKAQNIDLSENQENVASGLANLTIKAFLQVNPRVVKNGTNPNPVIYKNNTKQILLLDNNGQAIIYDDQYNEAHTIYDQKATNYQEMANYGYGNNVRNELAKSLKTVPAANTKLLVNVNLNDLKTTLLRKGNTQNDLFTVEYESPQQDKLVIKPANSADQNWFTNSFSSFNKMLNLFVVFEYQSQTDNPNTDPWKDLNGSQLKLWTDVELKANLASNQGKLVLDTTKKDIKKIRVRLVQNNNADQSNDFVKWINWNSDSEKLVSNIHVLQPQKINFDANWFNNATLSLANSNGSLQDLTKADVEQFETAIFNQSSQISAHPELKNKIKFVYSFKTWTNLNSERLVSVLKSQLSDYTAADQGIFTLWDGQNGTLKIKATMVLVDENDPSFVIVKPDGTIITDEQERSADIKSNIKTSLNLKAYFEEIKKIPLNATKGNLTGTITNFTIPKYQDGKPGQGQLFDKTYEEIEQLLNAVGIEFQFKEWDSTTNNWSGWKNKAAISKYNPSNPTLKIGLKVTPNLNIEAKFDNTIIDNNWEWELKLHLPKLVKADESVWNVFKNATHFSGNTFKLDITNVNQAEQSLKEKLIAFNTDQNPGSDFSQLNDQIEFKYRLGKTGAFEGAQELQQTLASQTKNQSSNQIWFQINLVSPNTQQPDFEFDAAMPVEQELLAENNQVVKKFIHGDLFEAELNQIQATGTDKENLSYTYPSNIQKIIDQKPEFAALNLQWTFTNNLDINANLGSDPKTQWVDQDLPNSVDDNVNQIYVRIQNVDPNLYVYGPDEGIPNAKAQGIIDLTRIATIIRVDKQWFSATPLSLTALKINELNNTHFSEWQTRVFNNINVTNQELLKQIKITFSYNGKNNLDATTLIQTIKAELQNYSANHLGIVQLWDGQNGLGQRIKATFAPVNNDGLIKIQDMAGSTNVADLTGDVNTANVVTEVDLINYVAFLKNTKTSVVRNANTPAGMLESFTPPQMPAAPNQQFAGQTYETIANRLMAVGINIEFAKTVNGPWVAKDTLKEYDAHSAKLYLSFTNRSTNINLKISSTSTLVPGQNNKTDAIALPLNVPKMINIQSSDLNGLLNKNLFSGNTKEIQVNNTEITALIERILQRNATDSGDNSFKQAPLKIEVKVGQTAFVLSDDLQNYLANYQDDLADKAIVYKFVLNPANSDEWSLVPGAEIERELYSNQTSPLDFYINDKTWEVDARKVKVQGTNENLQWTFGNWKIVEIDDQQLIETTSGLNGLRIEFTTQENPNYDNPVATDPNADLATQWVIKKPTAIVSGTKKMFIRLKPINGFVYGPQSKGQARIHEIDLANLPIILQVDPNWISSTDLQLPADQNFVTNLTQSIWEQFSQRVLNNFNPDNLRDKIIIKFSFNNKNNLDAATLAQEITNYLGDFSNSTKGYLQLFNGQTGLPINAQFASVDENKYVIQNSTNINGSIEARVDTTNVKTLIDLREYVNLLKSQPLQISKNKNQKALEQLNTILLPNFPNQLNQNNFANQSWNLVEPILNNLGITLEAAIYDNATAPSDAGDWKPWNEVKQYDPNIGKIWFRFKVDQNNQGKNIVLSVLTDQDVNSALQNSATSAAFSADLNVPLKLDVSQQMINDFVAKQPISGNTKFLAIDSVKEKAFIDQIIDFNKTNNQNFEQAREKLKLEYALGNGNQLNWEEREAFINTLNSANQDQITNQISFRFVIKNNQVNQTTFEVEENITIAVAQSFDANAQVKIYLHEQGLEQLAGQIKIRGTNNKFTYEYPPGLTLNNASDIQGRQGLKLQYSTKTNINNEHYNSATAPTFDPQLGWTNQPPSTIDPQARFLVVQIVATDGYIYGADYARNHQEDTSPEWSVHQVDVSKIQSEIKLSNSGLDAIIFNSTLPNLNANEIRKLESVAKNQAQFENSALQNKVNIEYKINWNNHWTDQGWVSIEQLEKQIQTFMQNYANDTMGLLKFNHQSTTDFASISARFVSNDNDYVVIEKNAPANQGQEAAENGKIVNTNQLITPINLIAYSKILKEQFIKTLPNANQNNIQGFQPPAFPSGQNNEQFSGHSFEQIAQALNQIGILVDFIAPGSKTTQNQWVAIEQIVDLNKNNELFLRFRLDESKINNPADLAIWKASFTISTKQINDGWNWTNPTDPADQTIATEPIKLKVDLPITLTTDSSQLTTTFDTKFRGNTYQIDSQSITEIKQLVVQLIQNTLAANSTAGTDVKQAPLKIQFSLDRQSLAQNGQMWFEIEELATILATKQDVNWNTNKIEARWYVNPQEVDSNGQKYLISDTNVVVAQNQNNSVNAPLKMYIHNQVSYSDRQTIINTLTVTGSNENYEIKVLDNWIKTVLPEGLQIQFSNQNPQANNWTTYNAPGGNLPKPLNLNKELWMRYQIKPGYQYQNAMPNDPNVTEAIQLDTSQLKTIIKLKQSWLNLIQLSGNTKTLQINEKAAKDAIVNAQVLPNNQSDLVQFEYSVDGKNWVLANQFQTLLEKLDGAKDSDNFILKREEIQVRFNFNSANHNSDQYQMEIDGNLIDIGNWSQYNVQLISTTLNPNVRGYIEISHLKDFVVQNFAIEGSNTEPRLVVKNKSKLEAMMQNYASDNLFDIWITGQQTNGVWDFSKEISLLTTTNKFISDQELIRKGFAMDANKKVALKFVAKNSDYDVYYQTSKKTDGYLLDISDNVNITFEITNPFVAKQKSLALWWTVDQKKTEGKYYQGQGGFKIVNGNLDGTVDETNFESAIAWLNGTNSDLSDKEKSVLEFVYYIYDGQPSAETIAQVGSVASINDYKDDTWKQLEPVLDQTNGGDFTKPLGLKVGQYVSVALRVKEEYATGADRYTLKNNQHSFMAPINGNLEPGRAHGYKIKTAALEIVKDEIALENILNADQAPLDGYTNIKRLNLVQDPEENYQGVDLELQLFHEFHQGSKKEPVLITPFDKIKLIKRKQGNTAPSDYFKDATGNEFKDNQGRSIPILIDDQGRPQAPELQTQPTIIEQFSNYGNGVFGLTVPTNSSDRDQWGLFRNETINVAFKAHNGIGGTTDPDFILDGNKTVSLQDVISDQIKFPLFNQDNIKYEFNHTEFAKGQVEFQNSKDPNEAPVDGKSQIKTLIKLTKISNDDPDGKIIQGENAEEAIKLLKAEITKSFNGKIRFETTYEKKDGGTEVYQDLALYKFTALQNNDRIKIRIIAADDNFIWAEPPKPLTIQVSGLTAKAPNRNQLQFLRIEQNGQINGQGSFRVLVNDPEKPQSDANEKLEGWKFVLRVWDSNRKIKQDWTDDQNKITNLSNGDKIEWKLVDQFNNPVSDPYYNTIAGKHEFNSDGSIKLIFNQVNYLNGTNSAEVINQGIGQYPNNPDAYPEDSGFVVSGLKEKFEVFEISETNFTKVINKLEPHYVGVNGQGRINFKETYLNQNYLVNTDGELYQNSANLRKQQSKVDINEVKEISLDEFLSNITFYTSDPNLVGYQNGFKFIDNETNIDNQLHNGDEIWAQFDLLLNNNEINEGVNVALGPVSGLQEVVTDQMSTLWYVMMALGGIVTLGGLTALVALLRRHKKLKR